MLPKPIASENLRIAPKIRETFFKYFDEGMSSASARNYHELLLENSQEVEDSKLAMALVLANAQSNPTERQIRHLYDIWRSTNFGGRDELSVLNVLQKKSIQYMESGMAKIAIRENPLIVVILTPIRKDKWCLCFRKNVMTRGNNTNNFVESSIRIFKDIVLQRCKAFNMCALVDFIVNVFESYHKRHILLFANNRSTKNNFLYMKFCGKIQNMNVEKINEYMYSVSSNAEQSLIYTVDIDLAMSDCPYGSSGKFCKHLCAVQEKCGIVFKNAQLLTTNDKKTLVKLSLGYDVSEDFFENMDASSKECDQK
ncbi:uncharacterized protein LOC126738583 [Anthonomus grandis grandis]|uniref:uncharacterized protein LOC126738583 n=1 Tax=Anthonomus grandis grandis TaxID=2921223 RepID=UPI002165E588|nr:uncharacterized protein LOC126738583 [Anthonomus grandis grandis]